MDSVKNIEKAFQNLVRGEENLDQDRFLKNIEDIIKEGHKGTYIFEMIHAIKEYNDTIYVHSMNVALICSIFGEWLSLSREETRVLTLAGLFHDIGKVLIPKEIVNKKGRLTDQEYEVMKTHSIEGYKVLKDHAIDIRIKYAALMHHERSDGSGYPNGFEGRQIEELSKIVAIADVYDAMTAERQYRRAICPFDVIAQFEKGGFLKFDTHYLIIFLERVVEAYLHNIVRLNDGREGEVVMINKLALSKPVVNIGGVFVDLSRESNLRIESII